MRAYLLRLLCGSMVCALVRAISERQIVKLLCGAYLAALFLSPAVELDWELPDLEEIRRDAAAVVAEGAADAKEAESAVIKDRCEAYILDEAAALGLEVRAEVSVDSGRITSVAVYGCPEGQVRDALSQCIARDLGVGKEAQSWENQSNSAP